NRALYISRGDGTFEKTMNAAGANGTLSGYRAFPGDFNGDGLGDILWDSQRDDSYRSTGNRVLWLGTGTGTFAVATNFSGQNGTLTDYFPILSDLNADGKTDILWDRREGGDNRSKGNRVLWASDTIVPDLMTGATTGVGATAQVTYAPL